MHLLELWAESVLSSKHFFTFFGLKEPSTNRKFQILFVGKYGYFLELHKMREKWWVIKSESFLSANLVLLGLKAICSGLYLNHSSGTLRILTTSTTSFFFIMASQLNNTWAPHLTIFELWRCIWQDYYNISNHYGKRTERSPIRSVIVRLIT